VKITKILRTTQIITKLCTMEMEIEMSNKDNIQDKDVKSSYENGYENIIAMVRWIARTSYFLSGCPNEWCKNCIY
jgi:hypothetical protein